MLVFQRSMRAACVLLVAVLAVGRTVAGGDPTAPPASTPGPTQEPTYIEYAGYFEAACPEGCRDVDKYVTCGAIDSAAFCNMTSAGVVTLACMNGNVYVTSTVGCTSTFDASLYDEYVGARFDLRTVIRFMYVFETFYDAFQHLGNSPPYIAVSCIECAVALYLMFLGVRLEKITRIVCGAAAGELMAIVALAAFNVTINDVVKGIPLWFFPIAVGVIAAVWRRIIAFLCGFGTGFMFGVIMSAEIYQRSQRPIDHDIFYIVLALTAVCSAVAQATKRPMLILFMATFSALCGTAAVVQLGGTALISPSCTSMTVAVTGCARFGAEAVFGTLFLTTSVLQIWMLKRADRAAMRRRYMEEAALLGGRPTTNESQVSMQPNMIRGSAIHTYGTA